MMTYVVLHLGACIFIYIGYQESFYPNTWIVSENLEDKSITEVYITGIYYCFVVLTTVGYGDIVSQNYVERSFTIIWMLFGVAFYSFTISFITFFFTQRENRKSLFTKKIDDFLVFNSKQNLNKKLIQKVINNLDHSSNHISYRWLKPELRILKDMPLELNY